jgi:hypothetical protein
MTGAPGKSGKASTPEHRQNKRAAGLASAAAKRAQQVGNLSGDLEFPVTGWIDYKDHLAVELAKRKILAADIEVDTARAKQDQERGRLFTRDQVTERDEIHNAAIKEALATVTDLIAKHVPPERITAAQAEARAWADGVLTAVADAIEGQ